MMHEVSAATILKLFGRPRIVFKTSTPDYLFGRISWNDDPYDSQDIAVDLRQTPINTDALIIARFLEERDLVRAGHISVARDTLRELFFSAGHTDWSVDRFNMSYGSLLKFELHAVDGAGNLSESFSLAE